MNKILNNWDLEQKNIERISSNLRILGFANILVLVISFFITLYNNSLFSFILIFGSFFITTLIFKKRSLAINSVLSTVTLSYQGISIKKKYLFKFSEIDYIYLYTIIDHKQNLILNLDSNIKEQVVDYYLSIITKNNEEIVFERYNKILWKRQKDTIRIMAKRLAGKINIDFKDDSKDMRDDNLSSKEAFSLSSSKIGIVDTMETLYEAKKNEKHFKIL